MISSYGQYGVTAESLFDQPHYPTPSTHTGVWVLPHDSIYEYKRTGVGPLWSWKTRKKGSRGRWASVNQTASNKLNADAIPRLGPAPAPSDPGRYHIEEETVITPGNGNGNGPPKWLYPVVGGVALISLIIILASVGGKKKGKKK